MNDCFLNLLFSFQLLLPLKEGADFVGSKQTIIVILESFYNLFIYKRFERKDKIEVTSWQPCLFLRFAVSCYHCHSS